MDIPMPDPTDFSNSNLSLSEEQLHDRILGAIVGSAIGDAMGASTEMWDRREIQDKFGYITGLTPAIRNKSPEGTWQSNMIAGSTTDDTRWKLLIGDYFIRNEEELNDENFAKFVVDYYHSLLNGLNNEKSRISTDALEDEIEKIDWIKEWARVALAYNKDKNEYAAAQNRFYGGEMSCAGMLYTPMFGLIAKNRTEAYELAFQHSFFDIGYARDISSLLAAMTRVALETEDFNSLMNESMLLDPFKYNNSRLVGRISVNIAMEAISHVHEKIVFEETDLIESPASYPGSKEDWFSQNGIYDRLATKQKAIAFHAGEIWQILIAGLEFGQGDFLKTIQFIVNYGRDNDTVAAVAGMILGARIGYKELPDSIKKDVVKVSKEVMGIDLQKLAKDVVKVHQQLVKS